MKKTLIYALLLIILAFNVNTIVAEEEIWWGADYAEPFIAEYLQTLPLKKGEMYTFSSKDTYGLLEVSSTLYINAFEMLQCVYRYAKPREFRLQFLGKDLAENKQHFDYGGSRIDALLPLEKTVKLEIGETFNAQQKALDVYLNAPHKDFIEIAYVMYDKQFGLNSIGETVFTDTYGMKIQKMLVVFTLEKFDLYTAGQIAMYAKNFYKPKKWYLDNIIKRQ